MDNGLAWWPFGLLELQETSDYWHETNQGRRQEFQRRTAGEGGVTLCQSEAAQQESVISGLLTHQIVMAFSSPVVACLLRKAYKRRGLRAPHDVPSLRPWKSCCDQIQSNSTKSFKNEVICFATPQKFSHRKAIAKGRSL